MEISDFYRKYKKKIRKLIKKKGGFDHKLAKQIYKFNKFMKQQADNALIDLYTEMIWYQFFPQFQKLENRERIINKSREFNDIIKNDTSLENSMYRDMQSNYQYATGIIMRWIDKYYEPKCIMNIIPNICPDEYSIDLVINDFAMEYFIEKYKRKGE